MVFHWVLINVLEPFRRKGGAFVPYESIQGAKLKRICLKDLQITLAKQVGELHALGITSTCMHWWLLSDFTQSNNTYFY